MANVVKALGLMEIIRKMALHMTDEELSEIGAVLKKVTDRIEKEQ